jgi:hypothetical protein
MLGMKAFYRAVVPQRWRQRGHAFMWRIETVWSPGREIRAIGLYRAFCKDLEGYRALPGAEEVDSVDLWPCLFDKTATSPVPAHYFYQAAWAARRILDTNPKEHVDVGSQIELTGMLSASIPVTFIDIRPLIVSLHNVRSVAASIGALPFSSGSVSSMSCLHVIEHIGLGRYGDPLDPRGTEKAARELTDVLAVDGNLFLSTPVGRERICFNAHRVHSPETILRYFEPLVLVEFSCEDDSGRYRENVDPMEVRDAGYTCGLFWFKKKT